MHVGHDHSAAGPALSSDDSATCPVMNIPTSKKEAIKKGLIRKVDGKTYFLCCSYCGSKWDTNPQKFAIK